MSSMHISWIVFGCVFAGSLLGMVLRAVLPKHHLSADSMGVMQLGMGLIATMAALVLGLLIASAQASFANQRSNLVQVSTNAMLLDSVLRLYGPEAKPARDELRNNLEYALNRNWPKQGSSPEKLEAVPSIGPSLYDKIQALTPQNESQRALQEKALGIAIEIGKMRFLIFEQMETSIPKPLLGILVFWLITLFISFGLKAPSNATVLVTLLICALSVAGATFLILELDRPYSGLIKVSSAPLRSALEHVDR